jgi:cold shock CspA family protein
MTEWKNSFKGMGKMEGFKSLKEGQEVTFEAGEVNGKSQALNVTLA